MDGILNPERSIHWRRRWWYAVWGLLLLGTVGLAAWWETPASRALSHLQVSVQGVKVPPGTGLDWWVGPEADWRGRGAVYGGAVDAPKDPGQLYRLPAMEIRIAYRRLRQGYIPRGTSDWLVVRLRPASGQPRYAVYNLRKDLNLGMLGPHRRMSLSFPVIWENLSQDPDHPSLLNY